MSIQHAIEPAEAGRTSAILRVRCTPEQVGALARLLAVEYPGQKPKLLPAVDQQLYTHWCRVDDTVEGLKGKFRSIELQLLLTGNGSLGAGPALPGLPSPRKARPADVSTQHARQAKPGPAQDNAGGNGATGARSFQAGTRPCSQGTTGAPSRRAPGGTPDPGVKEDMLLGQMELVRLRRLRPEEQIARLRPRFEKRPADGLTLPAGEMLAEALECIGKQREAADVYMRLTGLAPEQERSRLRLRAAMIHLAAGDHPAVLQAIGADEPDEQLHGPRGVALLRAGETEAALPHLQRGWHAGAPRSTEMAVALARLLWQRGEYHASAGPYVYLVEHAPDSLEPDDYAALIELSYIGSLPDLSPSQQLVLIEAFCERASPEQRNHTDAQEMVRHGLDLARATGNPDRLLRAYQHALDDLLQQRAGAAIVRLIEEAGEDRLAGRLSAKQEFELLDEVNDYRADYPQLLREPLTRGYEHLLQSILASPAGPDQAFAPYVKDLAKALRRLDPRSPALESYRQVIEAQKAAGIAAEEDDTPLVAARGRRIALVGGHERTREHVRERLESWGARVDEVPPPSSGRIGEREFDRILNSDLIVEIVSYMGHDMSTIITNLKRAQRLRGEVLSVQCRGMSGVCREIARRLNKL